MSRWAWAAVDLDAVEHNVRSLRRVAAPSGLWAVVKADGYGHGAERIARAALRAGAEGLCVALVAEGAELREVGIEAPILVLSQQPPASLPELVGLDLTATVYSTEYADALAGAVADAGRSDVAVHLKVDTGMQRVGATPDASIALVEHLAGLAPLLRLEGIFTHLACADEPDSVASEQQLAAFTILLDRLGDRCPPLVHAANSAATLALPSARRSFVRAGIAMYGISPGRGVDHLAAGLRPAMSVRARVGYVKPVRAGTNVSYGWRHRFEQDTVVATVPIGYADGVPRRLGTLPDRPGADVLIGGHRRPIVGVVTMDQLVVDVGDAPVAVGDDVVLIGEQAGERIRAEDWADRLDTIGYEIVCGIGKRVPRIATGGTDGP